MRPRSITPAIALLILLAPRTFRAADRIEIRPADVRWQPLPTQVIDVHVSPHDDRPWYVLRPIKSNPQLDTVKRCIEREFAQPAPQLVDATPALFEPTGRVWFVVRAWPPERNVLLGYDGKTWVERPSPKDQTFAARDGTSTPGHSPANVAVANRAFFPTHDHVHISDEANWSVHTLWERKGANDRPTVPTLIPEPDGKGLIAYAPGNPSPPWRWRDGKWTPLPLPPDARGIPSTMAWPRGDEGALFLLNTP